MEAYCVEHVAQKARREAKVKIREKAKKIEACRRGEEKEAVGVHLTTLEQSASKGCCPFGRC